VRKVTVTEDALREMVKEALENKDLGTFAGADEPVNVNPEVDPSAAVTNPVNPSFTPQNKVEFGVAVRDMVKNLPDEKMPSLFKGVKDVVDKDKEKEEAKLEKDMEPKKSKGVEESLRRTIRRILGEALPGEKKDDEQVVDEPEVEPVSATAEPEPVDPLDDDEESEWDPDAEADEDERMERIQNAADSVDADGPEPMTFKQMDQELGTGGIHNARQEFNRAILKARWLASQPAKKREELISAVKDDYIRMLAGSGELSPADIQLLHDHPDIVTGLDGFRDFLHTYIKRFARGEIDDMRNVEIDGDEVKDVKPPPDPEDAAGKRTYKIYGRRGDAPVHTRYKGRVFAPGSGGTEFKAGGSAAVQMGGDGKLKLTDPETGRTQHWEQVLRGTIRMLKEESSGHDCTKCYRPIPKGDVYEAFGTLYHKKCAPKNAKKVG